MKHKIVGNVTTAFGNGSKTSVNGSVSIATIYAPNGIYFDSSSNQLLISDFYNNMIRVLDFNGKR